MTTLVDGTVDARLRCFGRLHCLIIILILVVIVDLSSLRWSGRGSRWVLDGLARVRYLCVVAGTKGMSGSWRLGDAGYGHLCIRRR